MKSGQGSREPVCDDQGEKQSFLIETILPAPEMKARLSASDAGVSEMTGVGRGLKKL